MNDKLPITVILCDDHPLVLEGIRSVLEIYDHIKVLGAVGSARAALALAQRQPPDVVLMDINMPELSGLDAIELFREHHPETRLLMLSMHDSREYISTAVMYGASGYILKDVSTTEIIAAIEAVAAGKTYFSSGVADAILAKDAKANAVVPLTTREQSVLLLLARGSANKEIADQLDISVRTVETHRKNIKKKLGIGTTAGLTRYVIDNGLLGAEDH